MSRPSAWGKLKRYRIWRITNNPPRIWYSIVGYVSIISPLINFGLGHANGALSPWKYMYIFAGSITTLWGILLLFVRPPDPIRAKGFDERQRYILVARLRVNNAGVRNTSFKSGQVKEQFRHHFKDHWIIVQHSKRLLTFD